MLLEVQNVKKVYQTKGNSVEALKNVDFGIKKANMSRLWGIWFRKIVPIEISGYV